MFSRRYSAICIEIGTQRERISWFENEGEGKFLDFHEIVKNIWRITREYDVVIRYNIIKSPSTVRPRSILSKASKRLPTQRVSYLFARQSTNNCTRNCSHFISCRINSSIYSRSLSTLLSVAILRRRDRVTEARGFQISIECRAIGLEESKIFNPLEESNLRSTQRKKWAKIKERWFNSWIVKKYGISQFVKITCSFHLSNQRHHFHSSTFRLSIAMKKPTKRNQFSYHHSKSQEIYLSILSKAKKGHFSFQPRSGYQRRSLLLFLVDEKEAIGARSSFSFQLLITNCKPIHQFAQFLDVSLPDLMKMLGTIDDGRPVSWWRRARTLSPRSVPRFDELLALTRDATRDRSCCCRDAWERGRDRDLRLFFNGDWTLLTLEGYKSKLVKHFEERTAVGVVDWSLFSHSNDKL